MQATAASRLAGVLLIAAATTGSAQQRIPLPEHPRPDFTRAEWVNLNGTWAFQFDGPDAGLASGWSRGLPGPTRIMVPFPWGSALSGVADSAEIGWYARTIEIPQDWDGKRVFLVVGAADWHTTAWLDGQQLGTHQGGYTPFEFELTRFVRAGAQHQLVVRVDDVARKFKLEGKQGYGNARGIWQTPYLEARGTAPIRLLHFTPDIDRQLVHVSLTLLERAPYDLTFTLNFKNAPLAPVTRAIGKGTDHIRFSVSVPNARLWTLDDPFLYEVSARLAGGSAEDVVESYFGMRKISVVNLPGTDHPYIALNNKPVYLQLALDQAYHADGFYTFPTDEFMRDEILRAKQIGLNGLREHVKIEAPRKLYWADRLGMLIMADVPNSWGEPDADMRADTEHALKRMIERDYNHPSIFAWVPFNETWGLYHKEGQDERGRPREVYRPETQRWVATIYKLTKALDPTRLVEDNSVCCNRGHTLTDINSWHAYLPGWAWDDHLRMISDSTRPGSTWNFERGYKQTGQPNINSEFGNVWGYEGSTGDVDWSWDYHRAVNAFRKYPRIAGWLYTEHHDVINEWNGYWRFDRTSKETGLGELVEGMTLRDLHAPFYIVVGDTLSRTVLPGQRIEVPLFASFMADPRTHGDSLFLHYELYGWNSIGRKLSWDTGARAFQARPYMNAPLAPLAVTMPTEPSVAVLAVRLEDALGNVLHRNFSTFVIDGAVPTEARAANGRLTQLLRLDPAAFTAAAWTLKQWNVLDGLKVNGAGAGFFEYRVAWPRGLGRNDVETVTFVAELSAKQLFGKDREGAGVQEGDFMRGLGTHDPGLNRNAYPMTDEERYPSEVRVYVNGVAAGTVPLTDDPADHRGILSWHHQLHDRFLREAGSYGELVQIALPAAAIDAAAAAQEFILRLEVPAALPGGVAIYGRRFGRYPLDPTLVILPRVRAVASEPKE